MAKLFDIAREYNMKLTIELDLDMDSYNAKYGPGSEYWNKYHPDKDPAEHLKSGWLMAAVVEVLHEGFYDWDSKGWMRLKIDGKPGCKGCGWTEGHQSWCDHANPAVVAA